MKKAMIYVHGKGGSYLEAEQFKNICLDFDVFGVDYNDYFPWIVKNKIMEIYDKIPSLTLVKVKNGYKSSNYVGCSHSPFGNDLCYFFVSSVLLLFIMLRIADFEINS